MATEANVEPTKVFVEGLPTGVKEAQVRDMFEGYGEIAELNIVRCQGKNLPFATITYQTAEAATAAIDDCSDRQIKGYPLSVMPFVTDFAKRKEDKVNMLLLTELSPTVNPAQIRAFFSQFGAVFTAKVMYKEVQRQLESRCMGHVQFMDHDGFDNALQSAKKMQHEGKVLIESPSLKIRRRVPIRENLYVRGFDKTFTEDQLKEVFSQFGRIKSATIQKSRALQVSLKFGFVCFNQYGAAQRAIEALDNKEVNGITWVVRPHEKMQDRRRKQQQEYSKTLQNRNQRKISVVNLTDEITEDEVRKMFAESGEIEDIYILRPESQAPVMFNLVNCQTVVRMTTSEGIQEEPLELQQMEMPRRRGPQPRTTVFVTFKTQDDADKAVQQFNGKEVNGKAITVTKHSHGRRGGYRPMRPSALNQQFYLMFDQFHSLFCIPFERLSPAQQRLIQDINFPNDEETHEDTEYTLMASAFYYHVVSICEEEFGIFARLVPFILCSVEHKMEYSADSYIRTELYSIGQDNDKILTVARESFTQNLDNTAQFLLNYYQGETMYLFLRNLYAESKYRQILELSKDDFAKLWDAVANKLEVNETNLQNFISNCLQTRSFMELLQSTKNELDLSSDIPKPKFAEDPNGGRGRGRFGRRGFRRYR